MAKLISITGVGASGAAGSGSTPASLHLSFAGSGQEGVAFSGGLTATGGVQPYTFSDPLGTLPPGLTLNSGTGAIEGIPSIPGSYSFTGQVDDGASTSDVQTFKINIAYASGGSVTVPLTSTVGRDVGHGSDTVDPVSRLVSFLVGLQAFFSTAPLEYLTHYLSKDGGTTWYWIGWPELFTSSGQEIFFKVLRPTSGQTWRLASIPGTIPGDPNAGLSTGSLPAGITLSATFSVAVLAKPGATLGTAPTAGSGAGGSWPYNKTTPDGSQYWSVPSLTVNLAGAFADVNAFVITASFQDLDSSHAAIGPEHISGTVVPINGSVDLGKLEGDYGTDGFSYTRTGNIAYVRWKLIASNRVNQTSTGWSDFTNTSTRQTDAGGGVGYVDIPIASGGALPPGKVLGSRLDPASLGQGTQLDPNTGQLVSPSNSFASSVLIDPGFDFAFPGSVVDVTGVNIGPGYIPQWNYSCPVGSSLFVDNTGGHSGPKCIKLTGPNVSVGQSVTAAPGANFFFSLWAMSSNNVSTNHRLLFQAKWFNASGSLISTTTVTVLAGYIATWGFISGFVTAPAGSASVGCNYATGSLEPSTDWWKVSDVFVQGTIDQTANNQRSTTTPVAGPSDYSALQALSTVDNSASYYGRIRLSITAADGSEMFAAVSTGSAGVECSTPSDVHHIGIFATTGAGGPSIQLRKSSVSYAGQDLTFQDNAGVNHQVIAGVIVS